MDRGIPTIVKSAIPIIPKRTFPVSQRHRARGSTRDQQRQLRDTRRIQRAIEPDMEEIRLACPASARAVEAPVEQLHHVGPPLALELASEVLGSDGAVAVVFEAVLAP